MPPEAASSLSPRGSPSYYEAKLKRTDALKNSGAFESEGREGRQGIYNEWGWMVELMWGVEDVEKGWI